MTRTDGSATEAGLRAAPEPDLSVPRSIHIVGIGGAGMSAIAFVLRGMGHHVSGSDLRDGPMITRLRAAGITVAVGGHSAGHLPAGVEAVVISTAVAGPNAETDAARAAGVPVYRRAEALAAITRLRRSVSVAGSHGKTTTSSMLALMLRAGGFRPSFIIGGEVNEVGANALADEGEWLVVEADESDGTFLELCSEAAIVTNVEADHLDHYGGFEPLVAAFGRFVAATAGPIVLPADDPLGSALASGPQVRTFGVAASADYRIAGYEGVRGGSSFSLVLPDGGALRIELPTAGLHNARNAAAAAALAMEIGVEPTAVATALASFGGVARRFQFRGERHGVTFVDDYAHLPSEVAAAIAAAREGGFRRVIAVFQPHRYSRTASLWQDFADAFVGADELFITEIYAAGEMPQPGISGRLVARAVGSAHPEASIHFAEHRSDLASVLELAEAGDVVLTLGAGDLTTMPDEWLAAAP